MWKKNRKISGKSGEIVHIAMFFFNEIGKSIKCPRWILVKNEIQNRKIANLMNFSHANGEVRVLKTPRNHHKSKDHNFLHRSYTPKKFPAPKKNYFFQSPKNVFRKFSKNLENRPHKATLDTRDRIKEKHDYMNYFHLEL